jgi:hypothetical protein
MRKILSILVLLSIISLLIALLIILLYLTQAANIQVIPLQRLYWSLDKAWGWGRAIANLLIAVAAISMSVFILKRAIIRLEIRAILTILIVTFGGLLFGSVINYTYACCEMPVMHYFGFPFSWWRGIAGSSNIQSPIIVSLLQNSDQFQPRILLWGLITDLLFWLNIGLLYLTFSEFKRYSRVL